MMIIICVCPYIILPPPPSFTLSTTMYDEPAAQRDFTGITASRGTQEDQTLECVRGYSPVQDWSTSFSMSNTHESDAHFHTDWDVYYTTDRLVCV